MAWSIAERLRECFRRLAEAPCESTAEGALTLLGQIIDEVEDQYSGVSKRENPGLLFDGRMYPPQEDFIEQFPNGSLTARTRGHRIEIGRRGEIVIRLKRTGDVVFTKPGGGVSS